MAQPWEKEMPRPPKSWEVVRSTTLRHIRWHEMRQVPDIHRFVINDYGSVTQRTVHRHLKSLLEDGLIVKVRDDCEDTFGYIRANKPRWNNSEQVWA